MRGLRFIKPIIFSIIVATIFAVTASASEEPANNQIDCVIMDFSSPEAFAKNAKMLQHEDNGWDSKTNTFKCFEFTTVDGEGALKLKYHEHGSWPKYRFMPQFNNAGIVTEEYTFIRVTYRTDNIFPCVLRLKNNGQGTVINIVPNTKVSNNKFVISNCVNIYQESTTSSTGSSISGAHKRFATGGHCTFEFVDSALTTNCYIKEIAFFKSAEDAYAYYGDAPTNLDINHTFMSFGTNGSGSALKAADYGNNSEDYLHNTLEIVYAEKVNFGDKYHAKIHFDSKNYIESNHYYYKVLYKADLPDSETSVTMSLRADAGGGAQYFDGITDTNGEYVFSDVGMLIENQMTRFRNGSHCSLMFSSKSTESKFTVKGVFFFASKEEAESFEYKEGQYTVQMNGVDISKYQIVIDEEAPGQTLEAAQYLFQRLLYLTGEVIPIVDDSAPESDYEIIVGKSSRTDSYDILLKNGLNYKENYHNYFIATDDNKIYLTAFLPPNLKTGAEWLSKALLFEGLTEIPEVIDIPLNIKYTTPSLRIKRFTAFVDTVNVENPEVFRDDFSHDRGHFTEESYAQDFNIANGVMKTVTDDFALTYLHLYEENAILSADLTFADEGENGDFGLTLRYNDEKAWLRAGYDFTAGEWYIDSICGQDFYLERCASAAAKLTEGETYIVEFCADEDTATLKVNGNKILETDDITHFSPGRVGVYAEDITLTVDNVELTMLTGQGKVWKDAVHTKIDPGFYIEGGTVLEKDSETLAYMHHRGVYYESVDNGRTWQKSEQWIPISGYYNVIRLNDGGLLRICTKSNKVISQTSHDNGATWVDGGAITDTKYNADDNYAAGAGNMNDKIFQAASTSKYNPDRIFYSQNYESSKSLPEYNNRKVFCEFFYSDDNGATWTKSQTTSWMIEGNENETHFGECKFIECADGTIRMYNSWNKHNCIVYSDSTDGGKTFGPLVKMEDFPCSTSSMQFVRDRYADNDSTYYMVWVNAFDHPATSSVRCGLTLAYTKDGKNWTNLGEVWRWESTFGDGPAINHVVDPFIQVTKDYIICGSGFSGGLEQAHENGVDYHNSQRQHIYSIPKISFSDAENLSLTYSDKEYTVLTKGTQLVKIEAYDNTVTYSYKGTDFYYSDKYKAHVAILDASLTKADIYAGIEVENSPAEELKYNGDVNGDDRITASDAAFVSAMLHNPENINYTMRMRLEADVFGDHYTNAQGKFTFTTVLDAYSALYRAVGLE